jgi:hypothetical protein
VLVRAQDQTQPGHWPGVRIHGTGMGLEKKSAGDQTIWGFMRFRNSPLQTKNFQNSHVELHQHSSII